MKRRYAVFAIVFVVLLLIGIQAVGVVKASNPWFSTIIKSPTNSTYNTSPLILETTTNGLSGRNVYYSCTYSLDGKQNVTIPFTTETHEKSFSITMIGIVALPLLSEGFHSITVCEKVDIGTTPPKTYSENYIVNFSVAPHIQANTSSAPSSTPTAPEFPQLSVIGCLLAVASVSFVFFKRRKSKTA